MRTVVATILVEDDNAIAEDMGTIDYLEREFGCLEKSGIVLENARILDDDDPHDAKGIKAVKTIFGYGSQEYYSVVLSVLDEHLNRVEAHEFTSGDDRTDAELARSMLETEISLGMCDFFNMPGCTLRADIEVHDKDTYELLYIM